MTHDRPSICACPAPEVLADLALGKLPLERIEQIGPHVETCSSCQERLQELDELADSFVVELRQGPAPLVDANLRERLDAAEAISQVAWQGAGESSIRLGQYELLDRIGQGGMGVVHRARHTRLKRGVAVKLLAPSRSLDPQAIERFHREMEAVAALDHPNIVRAHDANEVDGQHFLVMELVEGSDLRQLVKQHGPLPTADACAIIRQAAAGLQHAHAAGLVHRDLKPSNLMLTPQGQVKILDLGLARLHANLDDGCTATDQLLGTPDFMAPEQGVDPRQAGPRADLYSLGCTLWFLLAGRPPFSGPDIDTRMKKLLAHRDRPAPPIRPLRPDVPAELDALLVRLMAKRPEQRPESASAVADLLAPLAEHANLAVAARGQGAKPPIVSARRRPGAAMLLLPLLAAAALGFWAFTQPEARNQPAASSSEVAKLDISTPPGDRVEPAPPVAEPPASTPTPPVERPTRRPRPAYWSAGTLPPRRLSDTGAASIELVRGEHLLAWRVIGPFLYSTTEQACRDSHPIEQDWVALGAEFPTADGRCRWIAKEVFRPDNLFQATGTTVPAGQAGVYYAACWVQVPSLSHEWTWQLRSDCACKLWINGQEAAACTEPGPAQGSGLQRLLEPGWNELLAKLIVPADRPASFRPSFNFSLSTGAGSDRLEPLSTNDPPRAD